MTAYVELHLAGSYRDKVYLTSEAEEAVRLKFNPSGLDSVTALKMLAAAFITACDILTSEKPEASRELAVAKTNMQTASMWAVLGATKESNI